MCSGYAAPGEAKEDRATEAEHDIVLLVSTESRYRPWVTVSLWPTSCHGLFF